MLKVLSVDRVEFCNLAIWYTAYDVSRSQRGYNDEERMSNALRLLNIEPKNLRQFTRTAKEVFDEYANEKVMTNVPTTTIFDFLLKPKTDAEVDQLLGFAALKSIVGMKNYTKVTDRYFLSRMAGLDKALNVKNIREIKDIPGIPERVRRLATEYQLKKLKGELRTHWGLKHYGRYTRGWYFTFKREISQQALIEIVERRRKSNIEKRHKEEDRAAIERALSKIFADTRTTRPITTRPITHSE